MLLENDFAPWRDYGLKCKSVIQCFVVGSFWRDERDGFGQKLSEKIINTEAN
jgi:hypothetical protein